MKKYWVFFKMAFLKQYQQPGMLVMRLIFLSVILLVMKQLWDAIGNQNFSTVNLTWYLAMNELLFFSRPERTYKVIENDIRSGNIGYSLIRPLSYFGMLFWDAMGGFMGRLPMLFSVGGVLTYVISGGFPATFFPGAFVILFMMFLIAIFSTISQIFIGLLALYFQSASPFYLVWQKLEFILGGLFFPLTIYPKWAYDLAHMTPFPYLAYASSRLIYEFSWEIALDTAVHLILWSGVAFSLVAMVYQYLIRKVSINGG